MIIYERDSYQHTFSRATYTRKVWKKNHVSFGTPTDGCWNTVHCGKRDFNYTYNFGNMASHICRVLRIGNNEFQYFFEKTDQAGVVVRVDPLTVRFYMKGRVHEFTRDTPLTKVVEALKALEVYGNTKEERRKANMEKAKANAGKPKAISPELAAKRAAAVKRTAKLMRSDYVLEEKKPLITEHSPEYKNGCPLVRVMEYRAWVSVHHVELNGVKIDKRMAMFLATIPVEPVNYLALAQMFAPMSEFLLLAAPKFALLVPQPSANIFTLPPRQLEPAPAPEVNELETVAPFYNKIYEPEPAKTVPEPVIDTAEPKQADPGPENVISEPEKAVSDAEKVEIVPIKRQRKPQTGTLALRKKRVRKLIDREEKADVMFYGKRRRTQAQFRDAVALNCFDRCAISGASLIRCEAAHLVAHARKGGASFKNGLLLRADLHTLFDAGECAIDPAAMTVHFSLNILVSDPDLAAYEGKAVTTLKPIKATNLEDRWTAFLTVYMGMGTAA